MNEYNHEDKCNLECDAV